MYFPQLAPIRTGALALLFVLGAQVHAANADPAATAAPQVQPTPGPQQQFHEGMPAEELQRLIGKPEKVLPVATKKGHAEVWIYKKYKRTSMDTVKVGTKPITIREKRGDNYVDVVVSYEDVLKNRRTEVFAVASFLIVNGQYITCTQTEEKTESFE
jgi:hypothetical protein